LQICKLSQQHCCCSNESVDWCVEIDHIITIDGRSWYNVKVRNQPRPLIPHCPYRNLFIALGEKLRQCHTIFKFEYSSVSVYVSYRLNLIMVLGL
jgi:hypothetical protein